MSRRAVIACACVTLGFVLVSGYFVLSAPVALKVTCEEGCVEGTAAYPESLPLEVTEGPYGGGNWMQSREPLKTGDIIDMETGSILTTRARIYATLQGTPEADEAWLRRIIAEELRKAQKVPVIGEGNTCEPSGGAFACTLLHTTNVGELTVTIEPELAVAEPWKDPRCYVLDCVREQP